jgi:hypothetical protein
MTGFCVNPDFEFSTKAGRLVGVLDLENLRDRKKITGNPSNNIETTKDCHPWINHSRYLFTTEEDFGCIYHSKDIPD